ncbi:carboxypeptidase regulatory-like domain-containing protein [Bremerella cremea]|uniref:Carboxypeptidase regulatory-like domain-containing protein n=1 Tax=Bremerella cremea TaxID=1031537 RepID=A0A368KXV2_9BACT|nr:carboxypeptidase regulatory-like domain-containing protein [Bremerella cremea]RCS54477.1 carboxypeptidase regulatory-like domain-containing protein [Bremerella cremea]
MTANFRFREKHFRRQWGSLAWLIGLAALVGCNIGASPSASVDGAVTLNGKPIPDGSIVLVNDQGSIATAALQPDGSYSLKCPPGKYLVAVTPPPEPDPLAPKNVGPAPKRIDIPRSYLDVGTSGLIAEVKEGGNSFDFDLDSKFKGR